MPKNFYISSHDGNSGISKYSRDFYELILRDKGYIHVDSSNTFSDILSAVSSRDNVHIELGIFQKKEIEILMRMLKANYHNVAVTLHDAPLIKYPFREFKSSLLNKASKFYDIYLDNFGQLQPYVKKIKKIYVLSRMGAASVTKTYQATNVHYLPHVVNLNELTRPEYSNKNIIFFGFIGPNKGIEYSLKLHQRLLNETQEKIKFFVVGEPLVGQKLFYESLKKKYKNNVDYLGYIAEENLSDIFQNASIALMPFKNYRFFYPFSGSILHSLKHGKVVFTTKVNTVSEIIEDGKNGFYLSGQLSKDAVLMIQILNSELRTKKISMEAHNYILNNHSPEVIKKILND